MQQEQKENIISVLIRAEALENIFKKDFKAQGNGLKELANSVKYKIGSDAVKKIGHIARIRNEAAHSPSTFKFDDRDRFFTDCSDAKEMLLSKLENPENSFAANLTSQLESIKSKFDVSESRKKAPADTSLIRSISYLIYIGIIMALVVQFASANSWSLPFFKSYGDAFATAFFLFACGAARTAYIWQNGYVGLGIFLTTIGGFTLKYKWNLPIVSTYEVPLYTGIFLILYGSFPKLLGLAFLIPGIVLLVIELWLAFTMGLAAVHSMNLLASVVFIGISYLMFQRHKKISQT